VHGADYLSFAKEMDDNKTWSIVESATDQQDTMDLDTADTDTVRVGAATPRVDNASLPPTDATRSTPDPSALSSTQHATMQAPLEPNFREMQVKVHVRRPGRDTWTYLGRASVTQEIVGHSSRVGEHSGSILACGTCLLVPAQ
jgi:hypothetical protein